MFLFTRISLRTYLRGLVIVAVGILTSCQELEEGSKGALGPTNFYTNKYELEQGVVGIYAQLHRAVWSTEILAAYTGAEDLWGRIESSKWAFKEADYFKRSNGNAYMKMIWQESYRTIQACNSFIFNANHSQLQNTVVQPKLANAYFVRGFLYMRLAMIFRDIPMPLLPDVNTELELTPMREVMQQVIDDFKIVSEWAFSERDFDPTLPIGDISKTAAKAYLAKVNLLLTGWPFHEQNRWQQVKDLTQSIIDENVYSLMDDYALCFQDPHQLNKEMIWAHVCTLGNYPIMTECRYFGSRWSKWMDLYLEWHYYTDFDEGYRKYFSTDADTSNSLVELWGQPVVTKFLYGTIAGRPEFEHAWKTSNDIPAMRFSEVLLMYAEACAQLGLDAEAIEKLNWVKRRAYAKNLQSQEEVQHLPVEFWKRVDPVVDYKPGPLSAKQDLVNAIIKERAFEFLGEPGGNHWLDLVRLERVAEANAYRNTQQPFWGDPTDRNEWFFPIPVFEEE